MRWLWLLPVGLFFMTKSTKVADAAMPRGIRNNNPGNIEYHQANNWTGQTGHDGRFSTFDTAENGIRALARLLRTYRNTYGLRTISSIITRWAPAIENNTDAYIASVERQTGIPRNQSLQLTDYPAVVTAIIHHENGMQPYSAELIKQAVQNGIS